MPYYHVTDKNKVEICHATKRACKYGEKYENSRVADNIAFRNKLGLPVPSCSYGYTIAQLNEIFGNNIDTFNNWMYGQTVMLCEGTRYNHDTKSYEPSECGEAHGPIVYSWDVMRYVASRGKANSLDS